MKLFIKYAKERSTVIRSLKVAFVVGLLLAIINHFDAIMSGNITMMHVYKIALTFLVPYAVATYGAAGQAREAELRRRNSNPN